MELQQAIETLLDLEGDFSDHPADPGGKTRWGITERVAREAGYTGPMTALPVETAVSIYRSRYWTPIRASELPPSIRYAVFDAAVNSGPVQAIRWLQQALGVQVDGVLGPKTLEAARQANPDRLLRVMLGRRLQFMSDLGTWGSFSRGWARRIAHVLAL